VEIQLTLWSPNLILAKTILATDRRTPVTISYQRLHTSKGL
jgi:hypothetical protein